MMIELEEFEPNRWRVKRRPHEPARSDLSLPYVISDTMDPTEQVDGKFYTSKREFRAVGRSLGLTEVGNEKPKPRKRYGSDRAMIEKRQRSIQQAIERFKSSY